MNSDKFNLIRFLDAQRDYSKALKEISNCKKCGHWMWYIFPQVKGLGKSYFATYYAISSLKEAKSYLNHTILGVRIVNCCESLIECSNSNASDIFGYPDDIKLNSSMTLFAYISEPESIFHKVLDKFFGDKNDQLTINIIETDFLKNVTN